MSEVSHDVATEARTLGWVPLEEFRGNPERWIDAETFLERGRTVMPILKKNNEKLESTVRNQADEIGRLKKLFEASQEAIQELQNVHTEATKAAVEKARKDLLTELRRAKAEGDVDLEVQLTEELADLKAQQKLAEKAPTSSPAPAAPSSSTPGAEALHPDFHAWAEENKWFGSDERKTLRAMGIAQQLRADPENDNLQGRAFYDRVVELMAPQQAPRMSKVEGTRPTGQGGSGSGRRGYTDLPAEAKAACDRQGKKLVGDGRAFKDMNAWRQYYTNLYFQGE
jgi:hypothetical protein